MNAVPIFNPPIPPNPSLDFLFHRWGYHQLGENGFKIFWKALQQYYVDGLNVLLNVDDCPVLFFPGQTNGLELLALGGLSAEEIESLGGVSLCILEQYAEVDMLNIKDNRRIIVELRGLNEGVTFFPEERRNCYFLHYEYEVDFSSLEVPRDNLKAFEQKLGFMEHGLTDAQISEFAPDLFEKDERSNRKRANNFARFNKDRALSDSELLKTVEVVDNQWNANPNYGVIQIRTDAGDLLEISHAAVKHRIETALNRGLISKEDHEFLNTGKSQ